MSKSESDQRARPTTPLGDHARSVRLSLKLSQQAVADAKRAVEESRRLLEESRKLTAIRSDLPKGLRKP